MGSQEILENCIVDQSTKDCVVWITGGGGGTHVFSLRGHAAEQGIIFRNLTPGQGSL